MQNKTGILRTVTAIAVCIVAVTSILAQDETNVFYEGKNNQIIWYGYSDVENSLYRHLNKQASDLLQEREEMVRTLDSREDWQSYQLNVRKKLDDILGPFPERTPLNATITKKIKKNDYRIEHIVFESQPGYFVTSSLFIPGNLKGRAPAILLCSGHATGAYRSEVYQHEILNYVQKGFIVFAFDPVAQGERLGYYDPVTGKSGIRKSTHEHSYAGAQVFLAGSSMSTFMAWDGIRAIDYLMDRPEVDVERVGITGRSGGGLQTALIGALDDRIYAASPECFITNMEMIFSIIGPQDAETNVPGFLARGLDHADFLIARAPKPTLIVATANDFFSIHGSRKTAGEVKELYEIFGEAGNFSMVEDIAIHASTKKNREAKYAFFQKHLRNPGTSEDVETDVLTTEELQVTTTGQVATAYHGETVFNINAKNAELHNVHLKKLRRDPAKYREVVSENARILSGYREIEGKVEAVYAGRSYGESYLLDKYYIQGEGDYPVPFWLIVPEEMKKNQLVFYLHPEGKAYGLENDVALKDLISQGYTVLAPDLLGTGETGPGVYKGDSYIDGISYNLLFGSVLLDRSIVGIRAGDINRLLTWAEQSLDAGEIYCVVQEHAAPEALHAALFDDRIQRLALVRPYSSYRAIVSEEYYTSGYVHSLVPGALTAYDLPDLAALFSPRKLLIYNPVDGRGDSSENPVIREDMEVIRKGYGTYGSPGNLKVLVAGDEISLRGALLDWLE